MHFPLLTFKVINIPYPILGWYRTLSNGPLPALWSLRPPIVYPQASIT